MNTPGPETPERLGFPMSLTSLNAPTAPAAESLFDLVAEFRLSAERGAERDRALPWAWRAACRNHPTPALYRDPLAATDVEFEHMQAACQGCPVRVDCAMFGVQQPGTAFYAGYSSEGLRRLLPAPLGRRQSDNDAGLWRSIFADNG